MEGRTDTALRAGRVCALASAVALACMLTLPVAASPDDPRTNASVSIGTDARARPIPRTFLGLSFELSSVGEVARLGESGNLVALLRSLGPGVLRFGGVSADTQVAWTDAQTPRPAWAASVISAEDLERLRTLAVRSEWRVLLTIGLAHYEPAAAAREVRAATAILGPWLAGIELGNEPNAYGHHDLRATPWTVSQYEAQVSSYMRAIAAAGPTPPLAGPDVSGSPAFLSWGSGEAAGLSPALLTGHHYPLGCHEAIPPSIMRLLSPAIRRDEHASTRRYVSASARAGIPFRLDEAGSVSCGGRAGISNTFGAALWAVDYVARTMAAGMAGINLHGNLRNCLGYSPLCAPTPAELAAGRLRAQPVWYALLLDRALLGDTPLASKITWERHTNIDVIAMRAPSGALHVVIVDDDPVNSRAVALRLFAGRAVQAASVLALRAGSPSATAGVTLGDAGVAPNGAWSAGDRAPLHADRNGHVTVVIPPSSAELVTLTLAEPARPTHTRASRASGRTRAGRA
jgi:hypothetical protein